MDVWGLVAIILSLALGIALILMVKQKKISADTLEGVSTLMEALPVVEGNGTFDLIAKYAKIAVQTVEQLVKAGKIGRDDEERKNAALDIVKQAAEIDKIEYGEGEDAIANACIEAEVMRLPRNRLVLIGEAIEGLGGKEAEGPDEAEPEEDEEAEEDDEEAAQAAPEKTQAPIEETAEDEAPGVTDAPPDDADGANG